MEIDNKKLQLLLDNINRKTGYDFREYSMSSVERRIKHRMVLARIDSIDNVNKLFLTNEDFADTLLKDLSINVTEMFRDPAFYLILRQKVVPKLQKMPFVKIWHAGCATGEEVYSMAILLREEHLQAKCRIFATDFNSEVISRAKSGLFSLQRMNINISQYLKAGGREDFADYYVAKYGNVIMDKSLRSNIVFANHNLVTDNAFGELQMIICRNVLIYFNTQLQNKVLRLFYDSLDNNGILCLGPKESLIFSDRADRFEVISDKWRIYKKI